MASPEVRVRITAKNDTAPALARVSEAIGSLRDNLQRTIAGYLSFRSVQAIFTGVVDATVESEQATAKLNAVLRTTGYTAGFTADQVSRMADELAQSSLFDDEQIRNAAAQLATFRNISGRAFHDALQAAVDLSTVMDQDLSSSIVQVGKALNDPIKGMTALQRVGVNFTADQRIQIKQFVEANDLMKAQKVILGELAAEFGGAGQAASQAGLTGALHAVKLAWDEWLESIGKTSLFKSAVTDVIQGWADLLRASSTERASKQDPGWQLTQQLIAFKREMRSIEQLVAKYSSDPRFEEFVKAQTKRWNELQVMIAVAQVELKAYRRESEIAPNPPATGASARTEEQAEAIDKIITKLREEVATVGLDEAAKLRWTLTTKKATEAEKELAEALRRRFQALSLFAEDEKRARPQPQVTQGKGLAIRSELMAPTERDRPRSDLSDGLTEEQQRVRDAMKGVQEQLASDIGNALSDGIANGFAAAIDKGSISDGFKALTGALLTGLGNAMVQFGKASLAASTLMQKIKTSLASLNPLAGVAASIAMIALGGALAGAAQAAFGGSGGGSSGYSSRGISDTVTRIIVTPSPASASSGKVSPAQPIVFSPILIGPNDPIAVGGVAEMFNTAFERNLIRVYRAT